jgi:glycosyltransferase involved in cell wall biosynthesis
MRRSHLLLLFAPKQCCSIPGKTFEYLAAQKPILCLADDGATADLIRSTGAGVVVQPDDVGAIKAAIWRLFQAFKNGEAPAGGIATSKYERKALTEQLSHLLTEIA